MIGLKDRGRFDLWLQRRNECFVVQKEKESRMKQRDDRLFILQGLLCPEWGGIFQLPSRGILGEELDTGPKSFENRSAPGGPKNEASDSLSLDLFAWVC